MPEIPRRLPPTAAERLSVVVSRMAGGSAAGATRWAQPVRSSTYRAADALGHDEVPVSTAPLLAVLKNSYAVTYDDFDPDAFYDVLTLEGLTPGRIYLIETAVLAATNGGGISGSVRFRYQGPTPDSGTTQLYVNVASGTALAIGSYDAFDLNVVDAGTQWVSTTFTRCLLGVALSAPAPSSFTLQTCGIDHITVYVHPTTMIRATDVGPVPDIS